MNWEALYMKRIHPPNRARQSIFIRPPELNLDFANEHSKFEVSTPTGFKTTEDY